MTDNTGLADLVDTRRYPLQALDSNCGLSLVQRCRNELDRNAISVLPDFLAPQALQQITADVLPLAGCAHRRDRLRTPYSWLDNRDFESDHPRAALTPMRQGTVTKDLLPASSRLHQLYESPQLTEFVRQALGYRRLHNSADPYLGLTLNVLGENDEIGWHFDAYDVVVGILLTQAEQGGRYEYAPYVRSAEDENYPEVRRVLKNTSQKVVKPILSPGTLYFFKGHRSVHRVTRVVAAGQPRLSAILCYNEAPGVVFSDETVADVFNSSSEPYRGTQ